MIWTPMVTKAGNVHRFFSFVNARFHRADRNGSKTRDWPVHAARTIVEEWTNDKEADDTSVFSSRSERSRFLGKISKQPQENAVSASKLPTSKNGGGQLVVGRYLPRTCLARYIALLWLSELIPIQPSTHPTQYSGGLHCEKSQGEDRP